MALFWVLTGLLLFPPGGSAGQLVYVSCARDNRIDVLAIDPVTGRLSALSRHVLRGAPGPMAASPDHKRVYVATRRREGRTRIYEIVTLERLPKGALRTLSSARVDSFPAYLCVAPSGDFLLTAHYGAGQSVVYKIDQGAVVPRVVDRERTLRTAHCIELDRSGTFALVPHTAPNRIYQYRFDPKTGRLSANQPAFVEGPDDRHDYHQPRHIRHHPRLAMAYSSNERGGGISAWKFDAENGTLDRVQTLRTLPQDFDGESAAAEVRITPDGRYAYVSNRDKTDAAKGADTLAGFAIDSTTGRLSLIGHFATARFPRSFTIDRQGAYLYAAGQRDANLAAYRIDTTSGKLLPIASYSVGQHPSWVLCLPE